MALCSEGVKCWQGSSAPTTIPTNSFKTDVFTTYTWSAFVWERWPSKLFSKSPCLVGLRSTPNKSSRAKTATSGVTSSSVTMAENSVNTFLAANLLALLLILGLWMFLSVILRSVSAIKNDFSCLLLASSYNREEMSVLRLIDWDLLSIWGLKE